VRQKNQRLESDFLPRKSHWEAHGKQREGESASWRAGDGSPLPVALVRITF